MTLPAGVCRFCRCAGDCRGADGDTCNWIDRTRTVCSAPACVRAYYAEQARRSTARRKRTPAEIHQLKLEEARARRRRYREARRKKGVL